MSQAQGLDNCFITYGGFTEPDIICNGATKHCEFLRHISNLGPPRRKFHIFHINAINCQAAFLRQIEPNNQVNHRGFASPRWPNENSYLIGRAFKVNMIQNHFFAICKTNIFKPNSPFERRFNSAFINLSFSFRAHHGIHHAVIRLHGNSGVLQVKLHPFNEINNLIKYYANRQHFRKRCS